MTIPLAEAMRDALNTVAAEGALPTPHDRHRPVVYMGLQGELLLLVLPPMVLLLLAVTCLLKDYCAVMCMR